ncbi:MAG TPA: HPr family phosphocarrier protein [Syntrophorhabdales bacterium]|nr:HPr family phosphocarrier protein [Syntrophorhabdales bacterium]
MDVKKIDLIPSELAAIQTHKYFMSLNEGREVSIEEAIQDFVGKYRADWLREKQRRDNEEQIKEIERHKYFRSREKGYDIGSRTASEEWIGNYAHIWREEKESLQAHGFLQVKLVVENEEGLHIKPASKLAEIARDCDCDMYVHRRGMEYYNFVLNGKEYLNVKSVLSLLQLDAIKGEELEFIATGAEAKQGLEAVELLISEKGEG